MINRYETEILDHTVTLSRNRFGIYDVAISGPTVTAKHNRTFSTLHEAKMDAHAFAHSALNAYCECDGLHWRIVAEN